MALTPLYIPIIPLGFYPAPLLFPRVRRCVPKTESSALIIQSLAYNSEHVDFRKFALIDCMPVPVTRRHAVRATVQ